MTNDDIQHYKDNTFRYVHALAEGRTRIEKAGAVQYVLILEDSESDVYETIKRILPEREQIKLILLFSRNDDETLKKYTERVAMLAPELSMYTSNNSDRSVPREAIINTLLARRTIPSAAEVSHILMELRQPGLFTHCFSLDENRRNYVIGKFLNYASTTSAAGVDRPWMELLQYALTKYQCKMTMRRQFLPESFSPHPSDEILFESWREEVDNLVSVRFSAFRRKLRDDYCRCHSLTCYEMFYQELHNKCLGYSAEYIKRFFSGDDPQRSKGTRDAIISLGTAMECTLKQINGMLYEANYAVVYPLSSWEEERTYFARIMENVKKLKHERN